MEASLTPGWVKPVNWHASSPKNCGELSSVVFTPSRFKERAQDRILFSTRRRNRLPPPDAMEHLYAASCSGVVFSLAKQACCSFIHFPNTRASRMWKKLKLFVTTHVSNNEFENFFFKARIRSWCASLVEPSGRLVAMALTVSSRAAFDQASPPSSARAIPRMKSRHW